MQYFGICEYCNSKIKSLSIKVCLTIFIYYKNSHFKLKKNNGIRQYTNSLAYCLHNDIFNIFLTKPFLCILIIFIVWQFKACGEIIYGTKIRNKLKTEENMEKVHKYQLLFIIKFACNSKKKLSTAKNGLNIMLLLN